MTPPLAHDLLTALRGGSPPRGSDPAPGGDTTWCDAVLAAANTVFELPNGTVIAYLHGGDDHAGAHVVMTPAADALTVLDVPDDVDPFALLTTLTLSEDTP